MRIDRVRIITVPLQLVTPLRTSRGDHTTRTATLVEVTADDGTVGWGENVAPEGGFYTGETADLSRAFMRDVLIPGLVNDSFEDDDDLDDEEASMPMADHAVSSALADIEMRQRGLPLAAAVGRPDVRTVRVGAVVGMHDNLDDVVAEALQRVADGYTRIKVKIAPGRDVDVVAAVRSVIPSSVDLHVDANGAYVASDIKHLSFLDAHGIGLVEQPFAHNDLASHTKLSKSIATPVCLDESVETIMDAMDAIATAACSVINVKPSRVGGFHQAVAILRLCAENGIDAWIGGMLESGIGRAGCLALATHPACTMTPDLSASSRYFAHDVTEPFELVDGCLEVPAAPGLGVTPLTAVLEDPSTLIETVFER